MSGAGEFKSLPSLRSLAFPSDGAVTVREEVTQNVARKPGRRHSPLHADRRQLATP